MSTVREFAERILFSTSLEEKLAAPSSDLLDEDRGGGLVSPVSPHRPKELQFSAIGDRGPKPREDRLEEEKERGLLLHFFCNHELLATEIMALALLKFPEAPAEFRKGLLRTLREEQRHTQWYLKRMADCGVSFGEHPVNGFFWRCITDMQNPIDYVSRLSLTFEQANLDYACHYSERFAEAGDTKTAALLRQIYKDEIAHVGYGLKWFRKWKGENQSDWQAFQQLLPFPLTPARAKGTVHFNAAGRKLAGLDEAFISSLELFSHSRGRSPRVYLFNPGAEAAAAQNEPRAIDTATLRLTRDLDTLSIFLAKAEDVVLLQKVPRPEFLRELKYLGVEVPSHEILENDAIPKSSTLHSRKLAELRPWGWSADSHVLLTPLLPNLTVGETVSPWNEQTRLLYTKARAAECLADLPWQDAFGDRNIIGSECRTVEEIWGSGSTAVVKANFGIAGRRMACYAPGSELNGIEELKALPGGAITEPWLERVADFSIQYEIEPNQLPRLKGFVRLHCDANGRFIACSASGTFTRLLPPEVARFLNELGPRWLGTLYTETIPKVLQQKLSGSGFRGFLGIDAFFYRDAEGNLKLKPIVEINPRCTMGRVTHELLRVAAPGRTVLFRIISKRAASKAGCKTFPQMAEKLRSRLPVCLTSEPKVDSGVFFINDPATAHSFLGVALVTARAVGPEVLETSAS